jgi:superoxide dismutase, Fe-Mn family
MEFKKLEYSYDALEPYIDAKTMEIHHSKHHKAYFDKFVAAIEKKEELKNKTAEEIVANWNKLSDDIKMAVRNNGGGFINHNLFWEILKKDVPFEGKIKQAIEKKWISFDKFKDELTQVALTQFGSGWAWLVVNNGELEIVKTSNQDTPLSEGKKPILGLDVWEHAYYLKYQNKRPEYVENFFKVINWKKVNELYEEALE